MKQSKIGNIVAALTFIFTPIYVMEIIALIILVCLKYIGIVDMIIATVAATLNLILLYGLDSALTRIEILENSLLRRKILKEDDFDFNYSEVNTTKKDELKKHGRIIEGNENITYCTECGYQLFPEDKFCPNCKAGKKNVTHKKDAK